jgi:hypothetical protein
MNDGTQRDYREVFYWLDNYGKSGAPDQRAIEDFFECEVEEKCKALKAQLYSISQGSFDEAVLIARLGLERKHRHGTFQEWGRLMLLWMSKFSRA